MRTWTLTTTHAGQTDLQVMVWPWQRQAYRFVYEWWATDPDLTAVSLVDDAGHAEPLVMRR